MNTTKREENKKTKTHTSERRPAKLLYFLFFISFAFWHHLLRSDSQGLKFSIFLLALLVLLLLCCCLFIFYFCLRTKTNSFELCVCVRACARVYVCVPEWCVHSCVCEYSHKRACVCVGLHTRTRMHVRTVRRLTLNSQLKADTDSPEL